MPLFKSLPSIQALQNEDSNSSTASLTTDLRTSLNNFAIEKKSSDVKFSLLLAIELIYF